MTFVYREDQDREAQKWMEEQTRYEDAHLGNFRRIYPSEGSERYDKFFHSSGSLYQETASFKARSECARSVAGPKKPLFCAPTDELLQAKDDLLSEPGRSL